MNLYISFTIHFFILSSVSSQYHARYRSQELLQPQQVQGEQGGQVAAQEIARQQPEPAPSPYSNVPATATPLILLHKQSLTHDGGFNFAFTADNGLQQGESIQPDGTRSGGYSYVDPNGKTISVRYTAGKDGFKILEGAHIPPGASIAQQQQKLQEAPQIQKQIEQEPQIQKQPQQKFGFQPPIQYAGPQTFSNNQYNPVVDGAQFREAYGRPQISVSNLPLPRYLLYKNGAPTVNAIPQEQEYFDEPGKAHSFGNGYSFEFSG